MNEIKLTDGEDGISYRMAINEAMKSMLRDLAIGPNIRGQYAQNSIWLDKLSELDEAIENGDCE